MATETWPPPADASTQWRIAGVRVPVATWPFGVETVSVSLRRVPLWGRDVWIDLEGKVLCDCGRMVTVAELGTPGNGHGVSPVGAVTEGAQIPWAEHQEGA